MTSKPLFHRSLVYAVTLDAPFLFHNTLGVVPETPHHIPANIVRGCLYLFFATIYEWFPNTFSLFLLIEPFQKTMPFETTMLTPPGRPYLVLIK